MASSEDEFDSYPDEFEGLDWNEFPALSLPVLNNGSHSLDLDVLHPPRPGSSRSSSHYSCDDVFDAAFLAEVDALESQAIRNSDTPVNGM